MRCPVSLLIVAFISTVDGTPWRTSSPMAVPRLPLVVGKDITARSAWSLSATSIPTGGTSSGLTDTGEMTDKETADEFARGGHSTMTKSSGKESAVSRNDTAPVTHMAHHSHLSKKRRRRKKEKLDGPHAMYAKKLKVRNRQFFVLCSYGHRHHSLTDDSIVSMMISLSH